VYQQHPCQKFSSGLIVIPPEFQLVTQASKTAPTGVQKVIPKIEKNYIFGKVIALFDWNDTGSSPMDLTPLNESGF
jgi:hypothetical protein